MKRYFVLTCVFLLLSAAACKQQSSAGGDVNRPKDTAADVSDPDAKAEFLKAARSFSELPFATAKVDWIKTVEGKDHAFSVVTEFTAPNRSRTKWLIKLGEEDGTEYLGMGKAVYVKTCWKCPDGGKWVKISDSSDGVGLKDLFTEKSLRRLADVKFEGEETVDGKKTSIYSYKHQVFAPVVDAVDYMTNASCKVWIRQDKGVPLKLRAEFSDSKVKSLDIAFDVEKPVKIEAPIVND